MKIKKIPALVIVACLSTSFLGMTIIAKPPTTQSTNNQLETTSQINNSAVIPTQPKVAPTQLNTKPQPYTYAYANNITDSNIAKSLQNDPIVLSDNSVIALVENAKVLSIQKWDASGKIKEDYRLANFDGSTFIFNSNYVINTYFVYNNFLYIAYSNYFSNRVMLSAFYLDNGYNDPSQSLSISLVKESELDVLNERIVKQNPLEPSQIMIAETFGDTQYLALYDIADYNSSDLVSLGNTIDLSDKSIALPKNNFLISPIVYQNQFIAICQDSSSSNATISFYTYYINSDESLDLISSLTSKLTNSKLKNEWMTSDMLNIKSSDFKTIVIPTGGSQYYAVVYINNKYDAPSTWSSQGGANGKFAMILKLDSKNYKILDNDSATVADNVKFYNNYINTNQVNYFYDTMKINGKMEPVLLTVSADQKNKVSFGIILSKKSDKYFDITDLFNANKTKSFYFSGSPAVNDIKYLHDTFVQVNSDNNIVFSSIADSSSGTTKIIKENILPIQTIKVSPTDINHQVVNQNFINNLKAPQFNIAASSATSNVSLKQKQSAINGIPVYNPNYLTKYGLDYYPSGQGKVLPSDLSSADVLAAITKVFSDSQISGNWYLSVLAAVKHTRFEFAYYANDDAGTINVAVNFYLASHSSGAFDWDYTGQTFDITLYNYKIGNPLKDESRTALVNAKDETTISKWASSVLITDIENKNRLDRIAFVTDNLDQMFSYGSKYTTDNKTPISDLIVVKSIIKIDTVSGVIIFTYLDYSNNIETGLPSPNALTTPQLMTINGFGLPSKAIPAWQIVLFTFVALIGAIIICALFYIFYKRIIRERELMANQKERRDDRVYLQEAGSKSGVSKNKKAIASKKIDDKPQFKYEKINMKKLDKKLSDSSLDLVIGNYVRNKSKISAEEREANEKKKLALLSKLDSEHDAAEAERKGGNISNRSRKSSEDEAIDALSQLQSGDEDTKTKVETSSTVSKVIIDERDNADFLYAKSNSKYKAKEKTEKVTKISLAQEEKDIDKITLDEIEALDVKDDADKPSSLKEKPKSKKKIDFASLTIDEIGDLDDDELEAYEHYLDDLA